MKSLLKLLLGMLLTLSIAVLTIVSFSFVKLTSSDLYKQTLLESNTYNSISEVMPEAIAIDLSTELNSKLQKEYGLQFEDKILQETFIPLVEEEVAKVVEEEQIKALFENNLDYFEDFVHGKDSDLHIYVPKEYIRSTVKTEFPKAYLKVNDAILDIPTCQNLDLGNFSAGDKISCIPQDIKDGLKIDEDRKLFINQFSTVFDEAVKESFLEGEDKVLLSQFVEELNDSLEARDQIEYQDEDLKNLQRGYSIGKYSILTAWVITGIGLILLIVLSNKPHFKKIFITAPIFILSGVLVLIPIGITYFGFNLINDELRSEVYKEIDSRYEEIPKLAYRIVENFTLNTIEYIIFGGLALLGAGILLSFLWIILPGEDKSPKGEDPKTETAPNPEVTA